MTEDLGSAPGRERPDARCPVCVFTAANVPSEVLLGVECWNCGGDLGDHAVEARESIAPGQAFAVNVDALRRYP